MVVIDTNPSKQRELAAEEQMDQVIRPGDFFGTTSERGCQIWHFDGTKSVRVGIHNPDHRSMTTLANGESLRKALERMPMFDQAAFVLHRMELSPGAFYPRMARPSDQHPREAPGMLPDFWNSADMIASSLNQVRSLVGMLDNIFQSVHPVDENMNCFGNAIRNLLILASTECEAQWKGVLSANGQTPERPNTSDFVKLAPVMRLPEYSVKLQHYPWLDAVAPFKEWDADAPTKSIFWYDNYNAAKHDREKYFQKSNIKSAIYAVSAVWILIAAQFGIHALREFPDLNRYFHLETVPLWRYSEVYTIAYEDFDAGKGPVAYSF